MTNSLRLLFLNFYTCVIISLISNILFDINVYVCVVDVSGVLVWGCNKHGQATKVPSENSSFNSPILISAHYFHHLKILRIFSGWTHMLAYTGRKFGNCFFLLYHFLYG